jgi:hypothetical protein
MLSQLDKMFFSNTYQVETKLVRQLKTQSLTLMPRKKKRKKGSGYAKSIIMYLENKSNPAFNLGPT